LNAFPRIATLASLSLLLGCTLTPARDALQAAQTYADAVSRVDADAMIAMWDPEVVSRGDPIQDKQMILGILDPSRMSTKEHLRGISPEFSDSVGMHFFVGNTRTTRKNDGTQTEMNNFYIVTSRDFGRTWKIVDLVARTSVGSAAWHRAGAAFQCRPRRTCA